MTAALRQGRHVVVDGVRLHCVRFGRGRPPVVLLPGITSPAKTWEFVAESLCDFADVYVLDQRGRGLSQGGAEIGYGVRDHVRDVEGLIQALELGAPTLLGHSMGARIASRFATLHPGSVSKLILADPPVSGPGRRPYPVPLSYYMESLDAVERGQGYEAMVASLPWSPEQIEIRMEWLPTCDRQAIVAAHTWFHEDDFHADLPKITARTLLLYAEKGGTVLDADAEEIRQAIPACQVLRVDGAGHMIPWDRLDAFAEAVRQFVTIDGLASSEGQ